MKFVYVRRTRDIGCEGNILELVKEARGQYVWIIGDDDVLKRDAIGRVLSSFQNASVLYILNYELASKDLRIVIKQRMYKFKGQIEFTDCNQLISFFGLWLGFISAVVIRRDAFLRISPIVYHRLASNGTFFPLCGIHFCQILLCCDISA